MLLILQPVCLSGYAFVRYDLAYDTGSGTILLLVSCLSGCLGTVVGTRNCSCRHARNLHNWCRVSSALVLSPCLCCKCFPLAWYLKAREGLAVRNGSVCLALCGCWDRVPCLLHQLRALHRK
jgi:hypothetical protein